MLCAVGAAIKSAVAFDAVADDAAIAVFACGRQHVNGAFEAVEHMGGSIACYSDGFVVAVTTNFALFHGGLLVAF